MNSSRTSSAAHFPGFLAMTLPEDAAPPRSRDAPARRDAGTVNLETLTRAVRAGDATAFARFYDLYSLRIYKHLLVLAHGDESAAREVFQTVAIKLAKKIEIFDDERPLLAWLQRVAHNAFIDYWRTRQREARNVPLAEPADEPCSVESADPRLHDALRQALEGCDAEERELLCAFYIDGRPLAELARQSGQSYKALESRLARLRRKVRQQFLLNLRHE